MSNKEKHAFITGATGFVGGALAEKLTADGWTVTALVRPQSDTARLSALGVSLAFGDVCQPEGLAEAMSGANVVFHCAALTGVGHRSADIHRVIVQGTNNLLDAACKSGVQRFVYVSSVAVYELNGASVCDEKHALLGSSIDPYAQAKIAAEKACLEACHAGMLEATIVRPVFIYGPGDRLGGFVPELVAMISNGKFKLIGGGHNRVPLVYIADLVDMLLLCAIRQESVGQVYNACSNQSPSWQELVTALCGEFHLKQPATVPAGLVKSAAGFLEILAKAKLLKTLPVSKTAVQLLSGDFQFPIDKAARDLVYAPRVSFPEGLSITLPSMKTLLNSGEC